MLRSLLLVQVGRQLLHQLAGQVEIQTHTGSRAELSVRKPQGDSQETDLQGVH